MQMPAFVYNTASNVHCFSSPVEFSGFLLAILLANLQSSLATLVIANPDSLIDA
jgi:hypothetical protein